NRLKLTSPTARKDGTSSICRPSSRTSRSTRRGSFRSSSPRPRTECSSASGTGPSGPPSGGAPAGAGGASQTVPGYSFDMGPLRRGMVSWPQQPARQLVDGREIEQPEGVEQLASQGADEGQPPAGGAPAGGLQ